MSDSGDVAAREAAIKERNRNVVVNASAGTGKTSLVVDRIVDMVAPRDGAAPISIARIAAITFTRKAAGELRVRTRRQLLSELASLPSDDHRAGHLYRALNGIDTAHIGTIHGFADRLLRKWPSQAKLDPQYKLEDDIDRLTSECFEWLVDGAQRLTLPEAIAGGLSESRCKEAIETILDAQRAGLRMASAETDHWIYYGLQGLVGGFVLHRDVDIVDPPLQSFDRRRLERYADEYLALVEGVSSETRGGRWLVETGQVIRRAIGEDDPVVIFHELVAWLERGLRSSAGEPPRARRDFPGDPRAWQLWKALIGDEGKDALREGSLRDDLLSPLRSWFAIRLARLRPVVLDLYDRVKSRHQVVDHVDLLVRLRNLLRDDRGIRRSCQGLFDHIFVDEFQDTDPLQAEVVLFLAENGCNATTWEHVSLAPGKLTVVGDPKQSIYRFRRADIGTYQRVVEIVEGGPCLSTRLSSSYRSAPGLVDWLNTRFGQILGAGSEGEQFRYATGAVFYQPLSKGRASGGEFTVHAVAVNVAAEVSVAETRALEAQVIARYVRWLVDRSEILIEDPSTRQQRTISFGDIAVLAMTTTNLRVLFQAFDRDDVPYSARGGSVFLSDPIHRQFLLGLCAIADRDDGVALAGLLRPPFFAIDLADLARSTPNNPEDLAVQARAIVSELRRRRFARSPGATARALLEDTGFARTIAIGPNGRQRIGSLRELCFQVEVYATREHLDFDATMRQLRNWIQHPARIDRPHPIDGDALRVMTVHQAKGLEFPVVVLWDSCATWKERVAYNPWIADRDGRGWAMRLDLLRWEEPADLGLEDAERRMREQERKRLVYVAATRARDLLVIPKVGECDEARIHGALLAAFSPTVFEPPVHSREAHAAWFDAAAPPARTVPTSITARDIELQQTFESSIAEAARPRLRPVAFTSNTEQEADSRRKGRFGPIFGETVHLAIGVALRTGVSIAEAVAAAVKRTGLLSNLDDAVGDVERTLSAIAEIGVTVGADGYELEYPICGVNACGELAAGYIDLIVRKDAVISVLDFKTDEPSVGNLNPKYVEQVNGYAAVVQSCWPDVLVQRGLVFTADGAIHWL